MVLTTAQVLTNLSGLKSPWNCPHGRPTMRHLADLRKVRPRRLLSRSQPAEPPYWQGPALSFASGPNHNQAAVCTRTM